MFSSIDTKGIMPHRAYLVGLLLLMMCAPALAVNDSADPEIQYLLETVGSSGCTFVRNGQKYTAQRAEDHLRMKYNKARKYIDDAEDFVEKIASKSSWTGKPYTIECPNKEAETSRSWLLTKLQDHRQNVH